MARSMAGKLEKIVGNTDGWKEAASKVPIIASATMREKQGTFCGGSCLASAYTMATTIGPTNHAAGSPVLWPRNPAPNAPAPSMIHSHTHLNVVFLRTILKEYSFTRGLAASARTAFSWKGVTCTEL